jgi:predicted DNA-binding transcriptional regulator AlpA
MLTLAPSDGVLGDEYLDRETVAAFIEAVHAGTYTLSEDWGPEVAAADNSVLEKAFLERLRSSRLGPLAPALHHRRLALFEAVREIGSTGQIPGFGLGVHNVSRCIGELETWMEGKRQELAALGFVDEQISRSLTLLTPAVLAPLLGLSLASLSRMRAENTGPRFAMIGARKVVYPYVAVADWLAELLGRSV